MKELSIGGKNGTHLVVKERLKQTLSGSIRDTRGSFVTSNRVESVDGTNTFFVDTTEDDVCEVWEPVDVGGVFWGGEAISRCNSWSWLVVKRAIRTYIRLA